MLSHKEQRENEVFVGNSSSIIFPEEYLFQLNSIEYRFGNVAFDIDGKIIRNNITKSLFIKKNSHKTYDKLMRKLSGFTTNVEGIII